MSAEPWRHPEGGVHAVVDEPTVDEPTVDEPTVDVYPAEIHPDDIHSDLAAELAAAAPRRWWNKATLYLGAAALLVGGFVAGAQVQKSYGEPATPTLGGQNRQAGAGNTAGGYFGGGAVGGQQPSGSGSSAAAAATTGKVKLVDGTTVYVETSNGNVVTVRTNGQTKVQAASASALKNLAPGDSVTVQGQSGSDGTVTATSVTESK